jgi:hypothetical protein
VQCCCCTFGRRKGIDSKHQKLLRDRYKERPSTI